MAPNVLLAAVQYLLLGGVDHPFGRGVHGGRRLVILRRCSENVCLTHHRRGAGAARDPSHADQRMQRVAIVPALTWVARQLGTTHALVDVGASAGLNLLCDQYRIDYGSAGAMGPPRFPVDRLSCARWEPTCSGAATHVSGTLRS